MQRTTNNYFILGCLIFLMLITSCKDCDSCYSFFDPINGHTLASLDSLAIKQGYNSASNYIAINSSFHDLDVEPNNSGVFDYSWNEYCDDDLEKVDNFEQWLDIDQDGASDLIHYYDCGDNIY